MTLLRPAALSPQGAGALFALRLRRIGAWLAGAICLVALSAGGAFAQDYATFSIVTSSSSVEVAEAITEAAAAAGVPRPSSVKTSYTSAAFEELCSGTASRNVYLTTANIAPGTVAKCAENGVSELLDARLGFLTLTFVQKAGEAPLAISPRAFYLALAKQTPFEDGFNANEAATWKDVDPALASVPVNVILPPPSHPTREMFEMEVMAGGCRTFENIKSIYVAETREALCRTIREDLVQEASTDRERLDLLAAAPPGSIALVTLDAYENNKAQLQLLPFGGFLPTPETVEAEDYTLTVPVFIYASAEDYHALEGKNPLAAWVAEALSEQALGPAGYLRKKSLSPIPAAEREWQRRSLLK